MWLLCGGVTGGPKRSAGNVLLYFASCTTPNVKYFQDGGLRNNNPAKIALVERALIWPDFDHIDTFLSVGTSDTGQTPDLSTSASILGCINKKAPLIAQSSNQGWMISK